MVPYKLARVAARGREFQSSLGGIESCTLEPNGVLNSVLVWWVDTCRGRTRIQSRTKNDVVQEKKLQIVPRWRKRGGAG